MSDGEYTIYKGGNKMYHEVFQHKKWKWVLDMTFVKFIVDLQMPFILSFWNELIDLTHLIY